MGTFLALTGLTLNGVDAKLLGLTDHLIHRSKDYEESLKDIMINLDFPMMTGLEKSDRLDIEEWAPEVAKRLADDGSQLYNIEAEAARRSHNNMHYKEYAEPKDRIPETVGYADM